MRNTLFDAILVAAGIAVSMHVSNVQSASGAEVYAAGCVGCHAAGVLGAPRLGVGADWETRQVKGLDKLVENAIKGVNAMPPKGGNAALGDSDVRAAVQYMLAESLSESAAVKAPPSQEGTGMVAEAQQAQPEPGATVDANDSKADKVAMATKSEAQPEKKPSRKVNAFNRLMKPPSQRNLPPMRDGIHDPTNDGTETLQHPREAFAPMPKANSGNRVDWVAALEQGDIVPWFDLKDQEKKPIVLDLNIVREVKGSMPDVVYPHKQHTEWLDCSNCHPSIFVPKKGANNISMASILLGQQCGVCHGKVAFPVSECRKCHSKNKPAVAKK